jgi:hypothetical protein
MWLGHRTNQYALRIEELANYRLEFEFMVLEK